jgi:hypothetical protein
MLEPRVGPADLAAIDPCPADGAGRPAARRATQPRGPGGKLDDLGSHDDAASHGSNLPLSARGFQWTEGQTFTALIGPQVEPALVNGR